MLKQLDEVELSLAHDSEVPAILRLWDAKEIAATSRLSVAPGPLNQQMEASKQASRANSRNCILPPRQM